MVRLVREFAGYLWQAKKLWLLPIVFALLLVGFLALLSELSPLSPFIYPFF
ncbi:MAG: hypothetical protein HN348_01870 [Proteobacteria bacterium]|jgi:hypothetical protein|nr:hypothetical protein [Pseudomonadota bacterium]